MHKSIEAVLSHSELSLAGSKTLLLLWILHSFANYSKQCTNGVFLTMELIYAKVSDESQSLWGYRLHNVHTTFSNKAL
jgi:hypothetical protein